MSMKRNKTPNSLPRDSRIRFGYNGIGPEDGDEWMKWVHEIVNGCKKGDEFEKTYVLKKDIPKQDLIRVETVTKDNLIIYKAVYGMKPCRNQAEFLERCGKHLKITDKTTFLRVYY